MKRHWLVDWVLDFLHTAFFWTALGVGAILFAPFLLCQALWQYFVGAFFLPMHSQGRVCHGCQALLTGKTTKVETHYHRAREFCKRCLPLLLLALTLSASAAPKPEPLTYKSAGRRYVIAFPDSQLWSQSEVARAVQWHKAGELSIAGQAIRQARVRGVAGDRTNRNYLVTVIRTGKRLNPEPRYMVRPDPFTALPMPPAAKSMSSAKSAPKSAEPLTVRLTWDDMPGAIPSGWGATDLLIMPDGGPKFWTVHASRDWQTWRTVAVTATNGAVIGAVWPSEFYRVHWRGKGAPPEVWP